jgi:ATP-dependent exoDNAse (exonuclease V) beta subunit
VIARLALSWKNPICEHQEKISFHNKTSGFMLVDHTPKLVGTLIHRILQQISQLGEVWWNEKSSHLKRGYVQKHLSQLGILPAMIDETIETVLLAIHNTLMDARGKWILHPHHASKSEYQLTAAIHHQVKSIIIDRTFVDETGTRWIIDYKTARPLQQSTDEFIAAEKDKYQQQMLNYAEAISKIDDRPIAFGLYFPLVPAWCELANITLPCIG